MKSKLLLLSCMLMLFASSFAQSVIQSTKNAFSSEVFQLSGYGQLVWNVSEYPGRGQVRTTANNSIDLTRAILSATGRLGSEKQFGYMLMYDFGPSACLHELYGEWLPADALNIRFGQCKIPFTIENPISSTRIETINSTRSVSAMSGGSGDFNQFGIAGPQGGQAVSAKSGRDAGLQLSGKLLKKNDFFRLEYYAGLFNGTGLNTKDNNNHKDFVGSAYLQPIKGLRIGGSVYSGKLYYAVADLPVANHVRNTLALSAEYSSKDFYGRSEYLSANDGGLRRKGCYGAAVWKFVPGKWEVLGKYDFYDKNTATAQDETTDITAGINYYFAHLCRIQLNYMHTDDKALGKNNAFATQLQLFF
ncbi:MAG: OprO/OprP family phosphate-selective porin [Candidatus Symbiothrix sp.]|nr:OprO/OprP family phosphate-selective porin [Candidatus Symbiothrix sp.]